MITLDKAGLVKMTTSELQKEKKEKRNRVHILILANSPTPHS